MSFSFIVDLFLKRAVEMWRRIQRQEQKRREKEKIH